MRWFACDEESYLRVPVDKLSCVCLPKSGILMRWRYGCEAQRGCHVSCCCQTRGSQALSQPRDGPMRLSSCAWDLHPTVGRCTGTAREHCITFVLG